MSGIDARLPDMTETTSYAHSATVTVTGKTWEEARVADIEGPHAIARAHFTTEWAGDIEGTSTCWLQIAYVDGDPEQPQSLVGPYTGYELVEATLDGRRGTFVLAATGDHRDGVARTDITVVAGSATGELAGLRGTGGYAATAMEYTLELRYDWH
jgi:hypothetical protein